MAGPSSIRAEDDELKRLWVPVASTHVDLHGDQLTLSALEGMVDQIRRGYIPVGVEHDPRYPPLGRLVDARLRDLADGETAIEVEQELWDPEDTAETTRGDGREIPLETGAEPAIRFDRATSDPETVALLDDLRAISGVEPEETFKKALTPIEILEFVLVGGIAVGFLQRAGGDLYDALKSRLKRYYEARHGVPSLELLLVVECNGHVSEIAVLYERPDGGGVEQLFESAGPAVNAIAKPLCDGDPEFGRAVVGWDGVQARLLYALRRDGFPYIVREVPDLPPAVRERMEDHGLLS